MCHFAINSYFTYFCILEIAFLCIISYFLNTAKLIMENIFLKTLWSYFTCWWIFLINYLASTSCTNYVFTIFSVQFRFFQFPKCFSLINTTNISFTDVLISFIFTGKSLILFIAQLVSNYFFRFRNLSWTWEISLDSPALKLHFLLIGVLTEVLLLGTSNRIIKY